MPETDNPRHYIEPRSLPIPSHQGLKITARSAKIYTCEVPSRKVVAKENYERRQHQMTTCGYQSVIYKPYQPIGEVHLDDKSLILSALGQKQAEPTTQIQEDSSTSSGDSEPEEEESVRQSKSATKDRQRPFVPHKSTNYKPKVINDIKAQVNKGRQMIHAVRLGFGLYRLVKDQQERKQAEAEMERQQKEEAARNEMKPPLSDSENSDDELDLELKSCILPVHVRTPSPDANSGSAGEYQLRREEQTESGTSSMSTKSSQRWRRLSSSAVASRKITTQHSTTNMAPIPRSVPLNTNQHVHRSSTEYLTPERHSAPSSPTLPRYQPTSARSNANRNSRRSEKLRSPRPFSPVHSNINYNDAAERQTVFRQLCALLWILEAMSQDQQPPVMPPISTCWKLKELKEDPKIIRKRVEKERNTDKDWVTFKQNPARFTQRGTRRATRRISIHPNFIHRFSIANNPAGSALPLGPASLRPNVEPRYRGASSTSIATESATTLRNEGSSVENNSNERGSDEKSPTPETPVTTTSVRFGGATTLSYTRAISPPPGNTAVQGTLASGPCTAADKKPPAAKLQKQRSFIVTTMYAPPSNRRKALQKMRAKNRAAKAFKSALLQSEVDKLSSKPDEQQASNDSRVRDWVQATGAVSAKSSRRFAAAAIAAFGTISLNQRTEKVPKELKTKFQEVGEEKALVLHDNLEVRDRSRLQLLERKLTCLGTFNNMYKALDYMRVNSVVPDTETNEEMRQRVTEECTWYKDLIANLPGDVREDRYCTIVLNKIASYGSLEGRKVSNNQFVKVLSTLRVWEICSPDINAAVEFVRDKIVDMSEQEFEEWFNAKFPQPQRCVSAPPARTSGVARKSTDKEARVTEEMLNLDN